MAENFTISTAVAGEMVANIDNVGKSVPNDEVKVVDGNGSVVDRNTPGELWVRSISNFLGYLNNPEKTKEALSDDGWLRTGYEILLQ